MTELDQERETAMAALARIDDEIEALANEVTAIMERCIELTTRIGELHRIRESGNHQELIKAASELQGMLTVELPEPDKSH